MTTQLVLLTIALVLFGLAAINYPQPTKFNFVGAGLFFWVLSLLVTVVKL